jgi:hypothetical protein
MYFLKYIMSERSRYIDFTVNLPDVVKFIWNTSFSWVRFKHIKRLTKCNHLVHLYSIKFLIKSIFVAKQEMTFATNTFFFVELYCIETNIVAL